MERPVLHCLVAIELSPGVFTAPGLVSLELAAELKEKGYQVVGPDPDDQIELALFDRAHPWFTHLGL